MCSILLQNLQCLNLIPMHCMRKTFRRPYIHCSRICMLVLLLHKHLYAHICTTAC
uniref:Uncharacterized protein n=1 Tax=Sparus aurata TaxID=8175 RepID=A0A671VCT1_SPAAU